jgi:hypothetical protein
VRFHERSRLPRAQKQAKDKQLGCRSRVPAGRRTDRRHDYERPTCAIDEQDFGVPAAMRGARIQDEWEHENGQHALRERHNDEKLLEFEERSGRRVVREKHDKRDARE